MLGWKHKAKDFVWDGRMDGWMDGSSVRVFCGIIIDCDERRSHSMATSVDLCNLRAPFRAKGNLFSFLQLLLAPQLHGRSEDGRWDTFW